jgi:hypothetical protein
VAAGIISQYHTYGRSLSEVLPNTSSLCYRFEQVRANAKEYRWVGDVDGPEQGEVLARGLPRVQPVLWKHKPEPTDSPSD